MTQSIWSEETKRAYFSLTSYLSPQVEQILSLALEDNTELLDEDELTKIWSDPNECLLNVDYLHSRVIEYEHDDDDESRIDFSSSVRRLAPYLGSIQRTLTTHLDLRRHTARRFLDSSDVDFVIDQVQVQSECIRKPLSHLTMFAMFERSLGDLFQTLQSDSHSANNKPRHVPFLLRDLLAEPSLRHPECLLGGPPVVDLLKLLLCGPRSLNLRNLAWHGFSNPDQYSDRLFYFLLALIVFIDSKLAVNAAHVVMRRAKFSLANVQPVKINIDSFYSDFSRFTRDAEFMRNLIDKSPLVDDSRKPIWHTTVIVDQANPFVRMTLLLPEIEHVLRKLYACVNSIEDNSCQIAFMDEFYLTMDDLLASDRVVSAAGLEPKLVMLLLDLFNYVDGPRIRDRLSHGEIDYKSSSSSAGGYYADMLVLVAVGLASIDHSGSHPSWLSQFSYEPSFHPIAVLRNHLIEFVRRVEISLVNDQNLGIITNLNVMTELLVKLGGDVDADELKNRLSLTDFARLLIRRYSHPVVSFKAKEMQLVSLLRNLIASFDEFQRRLLTKLDTADKETDTMRERQRKNLEQFRQTRNVFSLFLRVVKRLLARFVERYVIRVQLDDESTRPNDDRTPTISIYQLYEEFDGEKNMGRKLTSGRLFDSLIKILKSMLKLAQNLNVKFGENKWSECADLILRNERIKFEPEFFSYFFSFK